jgi:hypothetical protein
MTISRMQQPRQMYGLGSLVKSAVKGVKDFVKSDIGKAAIIGTGIYGLGGGKLLGGAGFNFRNIPGMTALFGTGGPEMLSSYKPGIIGSAIDKFQGMGKFGKAATMFGIGSLGGGALAALEAAGVEDESQVRDTEALKAYLRQGYKQLNQDASPEQVEAFVTANTTEYAANGGRIGFADGMPREGIETLLPKQKPSKMMQEVDSVTQSVDNFAQLIAQSGSPSDMRGHMDLFSDFIQKNDIDPSAAFDYVKRRVDEIKPGLSKFIFTTTEDMPVENKAYGGRIGYSGGTKGPDDLYTRSYKRVMELMDEGYDFGSAVKKYMEEEKERENKSYGGRIGYDGGTDFQKWLEGKQKFDQGQNAEQLYKEYLEDKRRQKVAEQKTMAANGGRIGYAFGSPEDNARQASGIMNLPLNQNPAGITELDLRDSGGFIPPVGVKEKADDIPAMLSNNEFVFTADAVKGMGDGDVNKGAQRMYDMMKKLEGGGRV